MPVVEVDPTDPAPELLARAAAIIRSGGLVAFPTETVYGLGANALDEAAVRRIFAAKGRPSTNPLIVHVADLAAARDLAAEWPTAADRLGSRFWPGPLTLVVARRADVPDLVTAGLPSVALRVPSHPIALGLLRASGVPIAAPSANRYTEISPTSAEHVVKGLAGRVDLVLDGGSTSLGIESTVVDLSRGRPVLLRTGTLSRAELEAEVGPLLDAPEIDDDAPRPSPGMARRHYAPRATLRLFHRGEDERIAEEVTTAAARGERVGALLLTALHLPLDRAVTMPSDPASYARRLYAALHEMDDAGCGLILVETVPNEPEWTGIRDRLDRAAHRAE